MRSGRARPAPEPRRSPLALLAAGAALALAVATVACGRASGPAARTYTPAAPSAAAVVTETSAATPAPAATRTPATSPSAVSHTAASTPLATPSADAGGGGSAAERTVRLFVEASGGDARAVVELPTADTPEAGHALVAVLGAARIQMYQVSEISVLPVGDALTFDGLGPDVDAIVAWGGYDWSGDQWLEDRTRNAYSTTTALVSWTRADGWRAQVDWATYAVCDVAPVDVHDYDGDGVPELARSNAKQATGAVPLCEAGTPQLFRWTHGAMVEVRPTVLPASAVGAAANNAAVAAATSGRWDAAADEIAAAVSAAPANATVHWNAALIAYRRAHRDTERQRTAQAVVAAAAGDFATAFRHACESAVPIADVITVAQAKSILAHASAGMPDVSTSDAAFAALPELTFRVAAREALAGSAAAGPPAALVADRDALARARRAVFGEAAPTATPTGTPPAMPTGTAATATAGVG